MPVPGWTGEYDWIGFIPWDDLPRRSNPPEGYIYTANEKIIPDDYPYFLSYDWTVPYRADRIRQLLEARPKHSLVSFHQIQADVTSLMARDFLPRMVAALDKVPATHPAAADALALLADWNGEMMADRPEPLIFSAWYRELTRMVVADELGEHFNDYWGPRPKFMARVLSTRQQWCDNVTTGDRTETCAEIISVALDRALEDLTDRLGGTPSSWKWGELHEAFSGHRAFKSVAVLGDIFNISMPVGGDAYTVNAARFDFTNDENPFRTTHGPSLRAIYDMGNLDRSAFIHSSGQSGHILSPHYDDMAHTWAKVKYVPMVTSWSKVEETAGSRLLLQPR